MQPTANVLQIVPAETKHHFNFVRDGQISLREEMKPYTYLLCPPKHRGKGKEKVQAANSEELEETENPIQDMSVGEAAQDPYLAALMGKMEELSVEATEDGEEDKNKETEVAEEDQNKKSNG